MQLQHQRVRHCNDEALGTLARLPVDSIHGAGQYWDGKHDVCQPTLDNFEKITLQATIFSGLALTSGRSSQSVTPSLTPAFCTVSAHSLRSQKAVQPTFSGPHVAASAAHPPVDPPSVQRYGALSQAQPELVQEVRPHAAIFPLVEACIGAAPASSFYAG